MGDGVTAERRTYSLATGKCGPMTMGLQGLGSCSFCLCYYKGQSAWPQWKRRSHVTATHWWHACVRFRPASSLSAGDGAGASRHTAGPHFLVHSAVNCSCVADLQMLHGSEVMQDTCGPVHALNPVGMPHHIPLHPLPRLRIVAYRKLQ